MATLASAIITSVRVTLVDPSPGVTWTDAMLLMLLNEGERNACVLRPDLLTTRGPISMVTGVHQSVPAGSTGLMRLDENEVGKTSTRLVDSALLDVANRSWPAATPESAVQEYCVDAKDRKRFRVLPPNDGTGSVVGLYGISPTPIPAVTSPINLDDAQDLMLKHFVLAEAYAADTKRKDMQRAAFYRASFEKMLGINAQSTAAILPKYGATPGGA